MSRSREKNLHTNYFPSKFNWVVLATFVATACVFFLNGPVGEPTIVPGSVTQRCVPHGRGEGSRFYCTAQLRDGSTQQFSAYYPMEYGSQVSFSRYSRRFVGDFYEIKYYYSVQP
jgi:hypothetical protein